MVDLAQYLPVILFIIVGLVFGVLPQAAASRHAGSAQVPRGLRMSTRPWWAARWSSLKSLSASSFWRISDR